MTAQHTLGIISLAGVLAGCSIDFKETLHLQEDGLWQQVQVADGRMRTRASESNTLQFEPGQKRTGSLTEPEQNDIAVKVPATLGTDPLWREITSPLGSARVLIESRGGAVPVASDLAEIQDLVQMVCDETATFVEEQADGYRGGPQLASLIRGDLRRDLQDIATVLWGMAYSNAAIDLDAMKSHKAADAQLKSTLATIELEAQQRLWSAAAAFLGERGWISHETAAMVALLGTEMEVDPDSSLNGFGAAMAASFMQRLGKRLGGLTEHELWDLGSAFDAEEGEQLVDLLNARINTTLADKPWVLATVTQITEMLTSRQLDLTANTGDFGKPSLTNGSWVARGSEIRWNLDAAPFAPGLARPPLVWTAVWVQADEAEQARWMGNTKLSDEQLLAFIAAWQHASDDVRDDMVRSAGNGNYEVYGFDGMMMDFLAVPIPPQIQ